MLQKIAQAVTLMSVIAFFVSCNPTTNNSTTDTLATDSVQVIESKVTAGITITTSTVLIPEYMGAGGTTDMFILNDPNNAAFITKIAGGKFNSFVHTEGHFSEWYHVKAPFGTKGNGYNGVKPSTMTEAQWKDLLQGGMSATYSRDFNLSFFDLLSKTSTKGILTINVARGTLQEAYYMIGRLTNQANVMVIYTQELPSSQYKTNPPIDSKAYPKIVYEWRDSIHAKFPNTKFYDMVFMPNIQGGKTSLWVSELLAYPKKMPESIGVIQYNHQFDHVVDNGNVTNDTASQTNAIKVSLPNQMANIKAKFPNTPIFWAQFSANDFTGEPYKSPKFSGRCIDVFYYMRARKVWIDATRDGTFNCLGASVIGLKNLLNVLDFKFTGIDNAMYTKPRYATTVTHNLGSQVDVSAGYENGTYQIVMQNRSGKEVLIPKTWNLDGKTGTPTYSSGDGYSCATYTSTTGTQYNPLTTYKLPALGIVEFEVKNSQ